MATRNSTSTFLHIQNTTKMMRSLAYRQFTTAENFEVVDMPMPVISGPSDVIIKVVAASINPGEIAIASGATKVLTGTPNFPCILGYDVSGTVFAVGNAVTHFKVGDEVFSRLPEVNKGGVAEYAITMEEHIAHKPKNLTHVEAASVPLVALTALQAFDIAEAELPQGLKRKTVLVPGALSGTGSIGIQLAKNVFGAEKVITTASTSKVPKVSALLGDGVADQIVAYTVVSPLTEIRKQSVDFMFDTLGQTLEFLSLMKPSGKIVSIATIPSGKALLDFLPSTPFYIKFPLDMVDWYYQLRAYWWRVNYEFIFLLPSGTNLGRVAKWLEEGLVRPVVGRVEKLDNIEGVRAGCCEVQSGKGGIGKFVIEIN